MATKNCLVTRLRALVDDDSLEILDDGSIRYTALTITDQGETIVLLGCTGPVEIYITGATIKSVYGPNDIQDTEGTNVYRYIADTYTKYSGFIVNESVNEVKLIVKNGMENITYISSADIDIDIIPESVRSLILSVFSTPIDHKPFNITQLPLRKMANIYNIVSRSIEGNISNLAMLPNKQNLVQLAFIEAQNFVGDISVLAAFVNLSSVNLTRTGTTGTVEALVKAYVNNGRTAGSIAIGYDMGTTATFDGQPISDNFNKVITWSTSDDTITISILKQSDDSVWKTKTISKNA